MFNISGEIKRKRLDIFYFFNFQKIMIIKMSRSKICVQKHCSCS